jgi:hypothetical protein
MLQRIRKLKFGIHTLHDLHEHLQVAMELEHATIPPYLCALYSIPDGANQEAARILKGVVLEEMLHLTLAANVLNATGGKPVLDHAGFIPHYPMKLPHSEGDFSVGLEKFSRAALDTFLKIERPAPLGARPEAEHYQTIGQFYAAIEDGLKKICEGRKFTWHRRHQVTPERYYGAGGKVIVVSDLRTALRALQEIVEQGEGFKENRTCVHGDSGRLGHYYRFQEIVRGRLYQAGDTPKSGPTGAKLAVNYERVFRMRPNPKADHYPEGGELREKANDFNRTYTRLLKTLDASFNGESALLMHSVGAMYDLKYRAVELLRIPLEAGSDDASAGPPFEYTPVAAFPVGA